MWSLKPFLQRIAFIASPHFVLIKCAMPYPHIINFMIIPRNVSAKEVSNSQLTHSHRLQSISLLMNPNSKSLYTIEM